MHRPLPLIATAAFLLGVVASCAPARMETTAAPLGGADWRLVELGGTAAVSSGDSLRAARISFDSDSGRVSGSGGCNRVFGTLTVAGDSLRMGPLASTKMACMDDGLNRQETAFLAALDNTRRYSVSGDTLTLIGDGGPLARLVATPGE